MSASSLRKQSIPREERDGMGRGKGREERKEVRWVWMGRNGLRALGLGFVVDVEAGFLSHGKLKAMAVAGGKGRGR
jgi:hypothetical protein